MEIDANEFQDHHYFVPDLKPKVEIEMPSPFILGRSLNERANQSKYDDLNGELNRKDKQKICMLNYNKVPIFKKIINKRKV